MADHTGDFGVDEFLRDDRAAVRFFFVVLGQQFKLHFFAIDDDVARVGFFNRQARTVLVVFAEVRDTTGERGGVPDFDDQFLRGVRFRRGRRLVLAATA